MQLNMKPMTAEEIRAIYEPVIEFEHPLMGGEKLRLRIRKGISPKTALEAGIPINNPLAILMNEVTNNGEDKPIDNKDDLTILEYMQRIARVAVIEPKYEDIEPLIGDDLFILSKIVAASTGLDMFSGLFDANSPFRQAEQGNNEENPVEVGISG